MNQPIITITNIDKIYPKREGSRHVEVLKDVSLTINKGEFLVLLGPSGCGKSTLLRIISNLDTATRGVVLFREGFKKENMNFVFQDFGVLPWLSVHQNVELGLIGRNIPEHDRTKKVHELLVQFGLSAFADHRPFELSGGMRQRVGLARAFATEPEVIFLDEPFSELDFFTARALHELLLTMWKKLGTTVVMVSHYIDEAVTLADRIAIFSNRPSSIVKIITNDLPRPRDQRSQPFYDKEDEALACFEK